MIHATRNGQKAIFSEHVWNLLPPGKEGWVQDSPEPPAEVVAAVKNTKSPEPPAEVVAKGGAKS